MKNRRLKDESGRASVWVAPEGLSDLICPRCGSDIKLWTATEVTRCPVCGHRFFRKETTLH